MKTLKRIDIAKAAGITRGFISRILDPKDPAKPSWDTAKKLGLASSTNPVWWADKDIEKLLPMFNPQKIKAALANNNNPLKTKEETS